MAQILVVDDESDVRGLVVRMVEMLGHRVFQAENGRAALDVLEANDIDLVLSDLTMPVMDGEMFLLTLRAVGDETPFVLVSGHAHDSSIRARLDADAFLCKPFLFSELSDLVDQMLQQEIAA